MKRGADLRAVRNRKLTIDGPHHINEDRTCIILPEFTAIDDKGKERKVVNEGDKVTLIAKTSIRSADRLLTLRAHPALYYAANIRMLPHIAPSDGVVQLGIELEVLERIDLTRLSHLAEVYVHG